MQQEEPETPKAGNTIIPMVWNNGMQTTTYHKFPERSILHPNNPMRSFNAQQWKLQQELKIVHSKVRRNFLKYVAINIQVQAPK
jgi:hypothetical protein